MNFGLIPESIIVVSVLPYSSTTNCVMATLEMTVLQRTLGLSLLHNLEQLTYGLEQSMGEYRGVETPRCFLKAGKWGVLPGAGASLQGERNEGVIKRGPLTSR